MDENPAPAARAAVEALYRAESRAVLATLIRLLGSFYLIEARDLDEAIALAAKIPPARVGCVEVRPVRPIREQPRSGSA